MKSLQVRISEFGERIMSVKYNLLKELEKTDAFISGEEIAAQLGVSRAAVWKAIRQLKDEGFEIESVTGRGYRLVSPADTLNADEIKRHLNKAASKLEIVVLESVDSTNNEAKRMLAGGFDGQALIISNEQTGGRGRLGRSFYSPKNTGIYMSFLLKSDLKLVNAVSVTTAASVAVVKAIEKVTGIKAQIKWVNDVYIGEKKVCGILTEAISDFETATARNIIIGIGINITTENFPEEITKSAASLNFHVPVRNEIIAAAANEMIALADNLNDHSAFIDFYRRRSLVIGKEIDYYINGIKDCGTAIDIDDNGGLVVQKISGELITLSSGEVTVRLHNTD